MKKLALFATLFAVVTAFAGNFEAECQKVEMWIAETFTKANPSFRLQHNILRRIRNTKGSDKEKIAALHSKFPKAFGEGWKSKLAAAKQQGITFSSDNKTLLKCPKNVTSVVIPSCVTTIGANAFGWCVNLTSVTIPNSVTTIGDWAFNGCENLTGITIPYSVTTIGDNAFEACFNLTSITLPDSVTTIGNYAFWGCRNLTSVTIPNSVTTIGNCAFAGCENLTSVTIPDSVTTIGEAAFQKVQKVQVSAGNTVFKEDDSGALLDMKNNRLLYLPGGFRGEYIVLEGITTIGNHAFSRCKNLTSVTIPNSVTTIGNYAFFECEKLTSITIPGSVTTIGEKAFWGCRYLTSIAIPRRCEVGQDAFPENCKVIRR